MLERSSSRRLALAAIATAALAGAAHAGPRPDTAKIGSDAAVPTASPAPKRETRYCAVGPETGTILQHRECRTRAEWLKRGVDPLTPR